MKNVVIIGAASRTAQALIPLLQQLPSIRLTLFARDVSTLKKYQQCQVIEGDAKDREALSTAIVNQDIVISALGGGDLDALTANIVETMKTTDANYFITVNAGGIYNELPEPFNRWDYEMVGDSRPVNLAAATVVEKSGLDYTILRPVWLTNKDDRELVITHKGETFIGTETSRVSVAALISQLVQNPALYRNQNIGLSQPNTEGDKPQAYR